MTAQLAEPSASLRAAVEQFDAPPGYLAAATVGIPPRAAVRAMRDDLDRWSVGGLDTAGYDDIVRRSREGFAGIVGVEPSRVAVGSQTSPMVSLVASAVPVGAEVLCVTGDFASLVFPFLQRTDIRVRQVPLEALADAITDRTWLVAFSLVQSANGAVADIEAILREAHMLDAFTLCDITQAAGILPLDASRFDVTVCHPYKWLCCPRGAAFMTVSAHFQDHLAPIQAGWYAGERIWDSLYGPEMQLAQDARRFDVSPAWLSWVGARHSIGLFAGLDLAEVWSRSTALGDALSAALDFEPQHQAIVSLPDDGGGLDALTAAGIRATGRAGRIRVAFHLWNTPADVDAVVRALRS